MDKRAKYLLGGAGFTLLEVLIVLLILSLLSTMMIMSAHGGRRAGLANQAVSTAQQNGRVAVSLVERDVRDIASGLFTNNYRVLNGGQAGTQTGNALPEQFNYTISRDSLEGCMVPPIEVVNGTDDLPASYINPIASSIGLTNAYRMPGSDMFSIYSLENSLFGGRIDEYQGGGQENFRVFDPILGQRMLNAFNALGGKPVMVVVIDDSGQYATIRTITNISEAGGEYVIKMEPSNDFNQPSNFKAFLEDMGYKFTGPGGPERLRSMVSGDFFCQVSAITYFLYRHPDASLGAQGWLVRLDMANIASLGVTIDADDPDTIRPYVVSENVADFQVAMGIGVDTDGDGQKDELQWFNDETMENFVHTSGGDDSVSDPFLQLVNDFREFRLALVFRTDDSATDDPYGFMRRDNPNFSSHYPDAASVARIVGISPQIEDHAWARDDLLDRLWYHRAIQLDRQIKIRNLDLGNTFARIENQ